MKSWPLSLPYNMWGLLFQQGLPWHNFSLKEWEKYGITTDSHESLLLTEYNLQTSIFFQAESSPWEELSLSWEQSWFHPADQNVCFGSEACTQPSLFRSMVWAPVWLRTELLRPDLDSTSHCTVRDVVWEPWLTLMEKDEDGPYKLPLKVSLI